MRKLTFILLLSLSATLCHGQILMAMLFGDKLNSEKLEFGMTLGNSFSTTTNIDGSKWKLGGFNFGLFFNVKISKSDRWYIHTGVVPKTNLGLKDLPVYPTGYLNIDTVINSFDFKVKRKMGYINLPILVRYRIFKSFYIEGGPVIGLRTKSHDIFYSGECHSEAECAMKNELSYTRNLKDDLGRFDVGIRAGIVYKYKKKFEISASFNQGFLDIDKRIVGTNRNQFVMLNCNLIVGAKNKGKGEKKTGKDKASIEVAPGSISTPSLDININDEKQPAEEKSPKKE
jgi:hypothetical protein